MNNEELEKLFTRLCDDVRILKNYLTGDIIDNQYKEGLIDKVNRHDKLFKLMIWLCGVSTAAIIVGCVNMVIK